MFIMSTTTKKSSSSLNLKNTFILSGVHGCTPTDLEFSYFCTQYLFQAFRTWKDICKTQCKPTENLLKIQKSANYVLPPAPEHVWYIISRQYNYTENV